MEFLIENVTAATISTSMRTPPTLAAGLIEELRQPTHLGSGGRIALLFRHVDEGNKWHNLHALYKGGREGQPYSSAKAVVVTVLEPDHDEERNRREMDALADWWRDVRRDRDPDWSSEPREKSTPTWKGWHDVGTSRSSLEFYVERKSLCVAAVLLQRGPDADPGTEHDTAIGLRSAAESIANRAVSHYWLLWERLHRSNISDAIIENTNHSTEAEFNHRRFFVILSKQMDWMLRAVAEALQSPIAALFVPDMENGIGLVSHVGYRNPGQPFRLEPGYNGLTRAFCMTFLPRLGDEAFQLPDRNALLRAYELLDHSPPSADPRQHDPTFAVTSDRHLLSMLIDADSENTSPKRGPIHGPWAYASVALDTRLWPRVQPAHDVPNVRREMRVAKREEYGGVLKIQGRIPHELDSPTEGPPQFARVELAIVNRWAELIALVFRRLVRSCAQRFDRMLLDKLWPVLDQCVRQGTRSPSLDEFTRVLRNHLGACGVSVLGRNPNSSEFRSIGQSWANGKNDSARVSVEPDVEQWLAATKDDARGYVETDRGLFNRYYLRLNGGDHVLAVVGVAHELPLANELSTGSRCLDYGFPRLVEEALHELEPVLQIALNSIEATHRGSADGHGIATTENRNKLWSKVRKQFGNKRAVGPRREQLLEFMQTLSQTKGTADAAAKFLGVARPSLSGFIKEVLDIQWAALSKPPRPRAEDAKLESMLVHLQTEEQEE